MFNIFRFFLILIIITLQTGSFFVYSRVAEPYNSIFINNRLSTSSLVEPITKQIQLQQQAPFLLYRNQRSAISGFWFYCKEDCIRIHSLLEKLIKKCNNAKPMDTDSDHQPPQQIFPRNQNGGNGVDIFSMLSKAQEDFNNSGVSENPSTLQLNQQFAGMQLNPQQQQVSHQPLLKQLSSTMPDVTSNVVSFFAAAQQPSNVKPKVPPVQTLDEIEKQHKIGKKKNLIFLKLNLTQFSSIFSEHKTNFNNLLSSVAQQQQSISPQPMKLQQPGSFQPPPNKPALITPAMLQAQSTKAEEKTTQNQSNIRPEPLTQNQLIQALNFLMESDPDFVCKLHEAYVKSFNKMVSM